MESPRVMLHLAYEANGCPPFASATRESWFVHTSTGYSLVSIDRAMAVMWTDQRLSLHTLLASVFSAHPGRVL